MSCQHPNCSRPGHSICTNHCHWYLCQEHINEHKTSLLLQFEEALQNLIDPTNEISKSIEQTKKSFNEDEQNELDHLKRSHQQRINKIDQQLIEIDKFQDQYNEISKNLIKIKTNENILTHDDFQQIGVLLQQINEYKVASTDKEENTTKLQQKQMLPAKCPLTHLNIYGLSSCHQVPLCSAKRKIRNLFEHFCNYHHLTSHYSNELINAMILNLDPIQTKIFTSSTNVTVKADRQPCPLHNTPSENGIQSTPCTNMVTKKFLPIHLKTVHRLRKPQIKEIMKED